MNSGLRTLPEDARDFKLGDIFQLPALAELPVHFSLEPLAIKHQRDSDFCTAYSFCAASELQENVILEPSWSFAMTKALEGDHTTWGADLRLAAKSHTTYGAIEHDISPYSVENKDPSFLRNPECWPADLLVDAAPHKKKTYFKVVGGYDAFDDIRASMWKFRDKKQAVVLGVVWGWPLTQYAIDTPSDDGFGHAVACVGWEGDYLIIQNSYGVEAGKQGYHLIHRNVINRDVERFGSFMLVDLDRTDVEFLRDNNIKADWSWLRKLWQLLINFFTK